MRTGVIWADASRDITSGSVDVRLSRNADFGLVIGIDHYLRYRSLKGAVADAQCFFEWLRDPNGGNVTSEYARIVVSRSDSAVPLQNDIDEQLLELLTEADAIGGGRRLYFFFSGHGTSCSTQSGEDVALLLATWSENLARLSLSADGYRNTLSSMGLFEELVMFFDCCRTPAVRTVGVPPMITRFPQSPRCATRTFIGYATETGRTAFEAPDQELWRGVFTHCLLAILHRAPQGISAGDLKRMLEHEVAAGGQRAHVINGLRHESMFGHRNMESAR